MEGIEASSPEAGVLERARHHHAARAWALAFDGFQNADRARELQTEDLERFVQAAYLVGRDDDYLALLERAHRAHLRQGRPLQGVRCAFWLGLRLLFRWQQRVMQSVFSSASPQERQGLRRSWLGEAELKTDWTKPPAELDAMGVQWERECG